ncbi:MAG: NAD-binding protein [Armatimonadetes bacterium]|nr:NAD-binding protein [Armatimonadota bacterium]
MFIIIVGGGKVGNYLAIDLLSSGQEISLIEKNKEKCNQISEILGSFVIQGDGCILFFL